MPRKIRRKIKKKNGKLVRQIDKWTGRENEEITRDFSSRWRREKKMSEMGRFYVRNSLTFKGTI